MTRDLRQREAALTVLRGDDWAFLTVELRTKPEASDWMIAADYKPFAHSHIGWGSGFAMTSAIFKMNMEPTRFCAQFLTLFAIGIILAHARCATRSLALPLGLHGGWIFANVLCSGATQSSPALEAGGFQLNVAGTRLPLIGDQLKIGLLPLATLVVTALVLQWWLHRRGPTKSPTGASS